MKTILYKELITYYVTNYYDLSWKGYCIHEGLICSFKTRDETDYEKMTDECPSCSVDDDADYTLCTCENYKDLYVDVYPLTSIQRMKARFEKLYWENLSIKYYYLKFYFKTRK